MLNKQRAVRWGVITAGRITHTFAKDIALCANTEIYAVGARDQQKANAFAAQYNIPHAYAGYAEVFNHPQVDAIYIASPHTLHIEHIKQAIRAGKHVLCEKPIVTDVDALSEVIALAKQHKVFVMEAMWTYFLPAIRQAVSWVESGEIGKLLHVRADFGYPIPYSPSLREYDAKFAGGCLLEMGIYPIAFNWLFHKDKPNSLSGQLSRAPNGVENDVCWLWQYEGSTASLHTSFRAKLPNTAILIGSKGTIQIPDFWRASVCRLYELEEPKKEFRDLRKGSGFEFQINHTCEAIRSGKTQSEMVPLHASTQFQELIESLKTL